MNVTILALGRRGNSRRPRHNRCTIDVEVMEGRALLASAAVSAAIYTVQQGELDQQREISQEVTYLKSNIVSIQDATNTFIYNAKSDILAKQQDAIANPGNGAADKAAIAADQKNIKNAGRDQTYAINQQNQLIKQLQTLSQQVTVFDTAQIKGLNNGKIDPTTAMNTSGNYTGYIISSINTIDTQASHDLDGLTGTFDSGTA